MTMWATWLRRVFLVLIAGSLPVFAQTAAVSISPAAKQVRIDSIATLTVRIDNVLKLHGYSVTISYDTSLIRFKAARKSSFLSSTLFLFNVDTVLGRVTLDEAILGSGSKDGSGSLAEVDFQPRRTGSGAISIVKVDLRDASNQTIPSSSVGASIQVNPVTDVVTPSAIPDHFALYQNYPNPFNPNTVVSFQLPTVSNVYLCVYDLLGREVAVLLREERTAGVHSITFDATHLSSGTYLIGLTAGSFSSVKRMLVVK